MSKKSMSSKKFHSFVQRYFYSPNLGDKFLAYFLSPLSLIYAFIVTLKKLFAKPKDLGISVISVGNLVVGGSGKTPLTKALYQHFSQNKKVFIVLRGYKRESKGMIKVALNGEILVDTKTSGDEAMEYALMGANVIVSEDRVIAINEAKSLGAELIILDDGFSKFSIKKFDIVLKPEIKPHFNFTLPSGAYRYPLFFYKFANFIPSPSDITKTSFIKNETKRMVLVTAIANPARLKEHFKKCVATEFFPDHYSFTKDELEEIIKKHNATSLLITIKDYVKIKDFGLSLSIIEQTTTLSPKFIDKISKYIK